MSLFNLAVKPHPFAPVLLRSINWAQPDDPHKKYPELGRMRYAWLSEDFKHVKLLLKDGPDSWTDKEWQSHMDKQIRSHEGFVDVKVCERDRCYLEVTIDPIVDAGYERTIKFDNFQDMMRDANAEAMSAGFPDLTTDPWTLFDRAMDDIKNGKISEEIENFRNSLETVVGQVDADSKIDQMAGESGIETNGEGPKIFSVDKKGKLRNPGQE